MSKAINLGRKPEKLGALRPVDPYDEDNKIYYPSLYLSDVDDSRLLDLPDEGECTIKFRVRRREHSEVKDGDDEPKRRCMIDLDVISIEPPPAKKNGNGAKDSDGGARKAFSDYFKDK